MVGSKAVEKLQEIFCLLQTLDDSLQYCWNEGLHGYYQVRLSSMVKSEMSNLIDEIEADYTDSL